ncbi:hypothetical protein [Bacillus ndiopicus]|uniref:hypothetical protein n=1 Tax=Bacillus ndiopicus TaxID=1347368 RepID=UPI0005A5FBD5|nr:hypothetical protein [Bacillus ndiopicus]
MAGKITKEEFHPPLVDELNQFAAHTNDTVRHITQAERGYWNAKRNVTVPSNVIEADPNTDTRDSFLCRYDNMGDGGVAFWYVEQSFYSTNNKCQRATSYAGGKAHFKVRHYYSSTGWSLWSDTLQWFEATPQNGWQRQTVSGAQLKYTKDDLGFVHLQGELKDGTHANNTVITTLPVGYRPSTTIVTSCVKANDGSLVSTQINQNGSVIIIGLSSTGTLRINTSFYVEV